MYFERWEEENKARMKSLEMIELTKGTLTLRSMTVYTWIDPADMYEILRHAFRNSGSDQYLEHFHRAKVLFPLHNQVTAPVTIKTIMQSNGV
jgi:hypothetical protein